MYACVASEAQRLSITPADDQIVSVDTGVMLTCSLTDVTRGANPVLRWRKVDDDDASRPPPRAWIHAKQGR